MKVVQTNLATSPNVQYRNSSGRNRQAAANDLINMYADTSNLDAQLDAQVASEAARRYEREQQDELFKKEMYNSRIESETALQKINVGANADNDAIRNLIRDQQEKVYEAQRIGRENPELQHRVPQVIAEQQAAVNRMMKVSTNIGVILNDWEEGMKIQPGKAGSIDVMTPHATQKVLMGIKDGSTSFVMKNGEMWGVLPGEGDDGLPYAVNLDKMSNMVEEGGDPISTVPDISETLKKGYDNIFLPGGKDNAELITFSEKRAGTQVVTSKFMSEQQKQLGVEKLVKSNQFKGIIEDDARMSIIWSNTMGKDTPWLQVEGDTREEIQAEIDAQKKEAAYFLANMAVDDNAAAAGVQMVVGRSKYQPPSGPKGPKPETQLQQAKRLRYEKGSSDARELLDKDPKEIANYLTNINRGNSYYEVIDQDYVDSLVDEEERDAYVEANSDYEETGDSAKDAARKMIAIKEATEEYEAGLIEGYEMGQIVDKDGNIIPVGTEEDISRAISDEGGYSKDQQMVYNSNASASAKKAFEELPDDKKPKEDAKYFEANGKRYLNPVYVPASKRTHKSNNQPSKSFKKKP
jgi:hypothetical protein